MNTCDCNKPKCAPSKCRTDGFVFRKVVIPAQLGDDKTGQEKPENGAMTNSFVTYEANGAQYIYDSFGVYTKFSGEVEVPVLSVNGKTGVVVLTTSDLENDSDYVTGSYVAEAIGLEAGEREAADSGLQTQIDALAAASDVTDIVGTHAELEAYDTSKLKDKDIIKVLQDESQNDETTYYRWSTATQTFTLIGEEGPYYTKSAADTKFQDKLTAGSNITISASNEISATDTTYSDFTGTDGTTPGTSGLVPAPSALDIDKYLKSDGTWDTVAAGPTVVQTTGTSTTDVMSQAATSQMIYPSGEETSKDRISIGGGNIGNSSYGIAIGSNTLANNNYSIAIGAANQRSNAAGASNTGNIAIGWKAKADVDTYEVALGYSSYVAERCSVALGSYSKSNRRYEISIGSGQAGDAATYKERYLANVKDPSLAQDAATKNYTDNLTISYAAINGSTAPTTATEAKYIGQLYYDTTNSDLYYCSAITPQGTDPETYTYTWTVVGGGPTVVQTTGTSTTDVMSQAATSQMIYPSGEETSKTKIAIGRYATVYGNYGVAIGGGDSTITGYTQAGGIQSIAIGYHALAYGTSARGVALGANAQVQNSDNSVALGAYSHVGGRANTVSIGSGNSAQSYGTRYLANVKDPSLAQDAATKNYVDSFYPVGTVYTSTSSTAPTFAGGTWTQLGTQTIGSSTVYYYERTA